MLIHIQWDEIFSESTSLLLYLQDILMQHYYYIAKIEEIFV